MLKVGLAIAACAAAACSAAMPGSAQGEPAGADLPPALVGAWGFAVATGNYCDPAASNCAPGSGGSLSLTFRADGTTEYARFESALLDGCGEIRTLVRKTGTTRLVGGRLVFTPARGAYTASNGCRPDLSGTWQLEPADLTSIPLDWRLAPDPADASRNALEIVDSRGEASGTYRFLRRSRSTG